MYGMFYYATAFHSDLSSWDVSSVRDMSLMYDCARGFNRDMSFCLVRPVLKKTGVLDDVKALGNRKINL
jgi:surface protein